VDAPIAAAFPSPAGSGTEADLRGLAILLLDTLLSDSMTSARSKAELTALRGQIAGGSPRDIREARAKLESCLARWRGDRKRQPAEASKGRREETGRPNGSPPAGTDACTGLADCFEAEKWIGERFGEGRGLFAAIFMLQRLAAINARFGDSVGDSMLLVEGQFLAKQFPNDRLFRWIGPSLLVVLERPVSGEAVRLEVARTGAGSFQVNVDLHSRSVLIPVSARWQLVASAEYASAAEFLDALRTRTVDVAPARPPLRINGASPAA
jgi:GGDEF domain-containing protein